MTASSINGVEFNDLEAISLASYNSTTKELFLCIQGQSLTAPQLSGKTELVTFYLQTKKDSVYNEDIPPVKDQNIRLMRADEYKTSACPSPAVVPGELSSKSYVFGAKVEDLVANRELIVDYVTTGIVKETSVTTTNPSVDVAISVYNSSNSFGGNTSGTDGFEVESIKPGTYTVKLTAPGSLGYTITNVPIVKRETTPLPAVNLVFGDYTQNGVINIEDINSIITAAANHQDSDILADVNGNGAVNIEDINIVIGNYNMTSDMMVTEWTAS